MRFRTKLLVILLLVIFLAVVLAINGTAIVGNIGSEERMEYTAIGDTVNLASRLESATKEVGVDVLIAESTFQRINGEFRAQDRARSRQRAQRAGDDLGD